MESLSRIDKVWTGVRIEPSPGKCLTAIHTFRSISLLEKVRMSAIAVHRAAGGFTLWVTLRGRRDVVSRLSKLIER